MILPETAKPDAISSEPALKNVEQLGGPLNSKDSNSLSDIQAFRLSRLCAQRLNTASTVATLTYGVVR
jgi:hypothetical protein